MVSGWPEELAAATIGGGDIPPGGGNFPAGGSRWGASPQKSMRVPLSCVNWLRRLFLRPGTVQFRD